MPSLDKDWQNFQRDCDIFPAYSDFLYGVDKRPAAFREIGLHPQLSLPDKHSQQSGLALTHPVVLSDGLVGQHAVLSMVDRPDALFMKVEKLGSFSIVDNTPEIVAVTKENVGNFCDMVSQHNTAQPVSQGMQLPMYQQVPIHDTYVKREVAGSSQRFTIPERMGRQRATSKGSPIQPIRQHTCLSGQLSCNTGLETSKLQSFGNPASGSKASQLPAYPHAQSPVAPIAPRFWSAFTVTPQLLPSTTTPCQALCSGDPTLGDRYLIIHIDDLIADPCYSILPNEFRSEQNSRVKKYWSALLRPGVPTQGQYDAVYRIHLFSQNLAHLMATTIANMESRGFAHEIQQLKNHAARCLPRLSVLHPQPLRISDSPVEGLSQQMLNYIHQQIPTLHCALRVIHSKAPHPTLNAPEDNEIILGYRQLTDSWIRRLIMVIGDKGKEYAFSCVNVGAMAAAQRRNNLQYCTAHSMPEYKAKIASGLEVSHTKW